MAESRNGIGEDGFESVDNENIALIKTWLETFREFRGIEQQVANFFFKAGEKSVDLVSRGRLNIAKLSVALGFFRKHRENILKLLQEPDSGGALTELISQLNTLLSDNEASQKVGIVLMGE